MRRFLRGWGWVPIVAVLVLAVDQWTKGLVRANLPLNGVLVPFPPLEPWFKIVRWENTGAAFGILQGQGTIFIGVAVLVIVGVLIYLRQLPAGEWPVRLCLGLQLGGAAGNLVDRLRFGNHVTDFLLFTLPLRGRVLMWPAFNVADSCIVIGVLVLAVLLLHEEGPRTETDPPASHSVPAASPETPPSRHETL